MTVACDTDYLTKVEHWDLAEAALSVLGTTREESYRLPAVVHQLRGKRFRERFGADIPRMLASIEKYKVLSGDASAVWLNKLAGQHDIDSGEADLLARVADGEVLIMATGDKRCLRQLGKVEGLGEAVARRIVTLDQMLLHLCEVRGVTFVRELVTPRSAADSGMKTVFSPYASDESVLEGLRSYHSALLRESGLTLWSP